MENKISNVKSTGLHLDKETLEFAIKTAWQYEFTCKNTKEGRAMAHAYSTIQKTLTSYLSRTED